MREYTATDTHVGEAAEGHTECNTVRELCNEIGDLYSEHQIRTVVLSACDITNTAHLRLHNLYGDGKGSCAVFVELGRVL